MGASGPQKFVFIALAGNLCALFGCSANSSSSVAAPNAPRQTAQLDRFSQCAVKQHTEVWCWAACAEMVHRYYNQPMTQEEIVARIMQRSASDPKAEAAADRQEVLGALDPELFDYLQKSDYSKPTWEQKILETGHMRWGVSVKDLANMPREPHLGYSPGRLAASLQEDHAPVILALKPMADGDSGHIVVVHQVVYQESDSSPGAGAAIGSAFESAASQTFGNLLGSPSPRPKVQDQQVSHLYTIVQATYMDPDTGKDTVISASELVTRADFIATRMDADNYLKYLKALEVWSEDIANGNNTGAQQGPMSAGYTAGKKS
jgi:hypothetical protein